MTPRERVRVSLEHSQPDHTPCDYFATPEIQQALLDHFRIKEDAELRDRLGTDIRYVNPPYTGPKMPSFDDGSTMDIWGYRLKPTANEYGEYDESVTSPYAQWETVAQAEDFNWPSPDWYDYQAIGAMCKKFPELALATGRYGIGDFINGVARGRGVEQVLIDIALEDPVYLYVVEKRHRFFLEHIDRILSAAADRIDIVLCGDDFGTQRAPLISPEKLAKLFAGRKKEFFDMVHSHGARVSHHCCGSSRAFIPRFIEMGMDALQTIQPQAVGMNPYELKEDFGDKISFHGAVDVQGWLQRAKPQEIKAEVNHLMDEVGRNGGLILAPCHNLQPDTPVENVLAIYEAVAQRRETS